MSNITDIREFIKEKHHVQDGSVAVALQDVCPTCKGAGFLRADVPFGHHNFGKPVPCVCKLVERKIRQQKKLLELSGISDLERFKDAAFNTFNLSVPGVQEAYLQAVAYANDPQGWLVITGSYGCGKTHMAVAIARQRVEAGGVVLVLTVPDLLDYLRSAFAPDAEQSYEARFNQIREAEMLVLDDFGAEQETNWVKEKLFQLLNYRYNQCLPTIITSNNTHMQGIDPRIYSRLCDKKLVHWIKMIGARDYRQCGADQDEDE